MTTRIQFSGLEQKVLAVLWSNGPLTAEAIAKALPGRRVLKDSTIRTVLSRLEVKRAVRHEVVGRANVYRHVVEADAIAIRGVRQILDRFLGGSVEALLIGMVEDEVIDATELEKLATRVRKAREGKR